MKLEQAIKSDLRRPKFRRRAIEKILYRLLIELKIEDVNLIEKLMYSLVDVISDKLEGQRYTNDDITLMFKPIETTANDLVKVNNISVSIISADDLSNCDLNVRIGYIPNNLRLSNENICSIASLVGKRIQSEIDFVKSLYYVVSKLLNTKNIAIYVDSCYGCEYFMNGEFKNNQYLWQAFMK